MPSFPPPPGTDPPPPLPVPAPGTRFPYSRFPFRDYAATLDTPDGALNYWVKGRTYRDRYHETGGATATVELVVDGDDAPSFIRYAIGFTERVAGTPATLSRHLPLKLPYSDTLYLVDLAMVPDQGGFDADAAQDYWPTWPHVTYTAEFETRPYKLMEDADVPFTASGAVNELYRYVTRLPMHGGRERKVPQFGLGYVTGSPAKWQPLGEVGFIIDRSCDITYKWWHVPTEAYPEKAVADAIGTVNGVLFDGAGGLGLGGGNYDPGTLLFRGLAERPEPQPDRGGGLSVSPVYHFSHRPTGWNNYVPVGTPGTPATPIPWTVGSATGNPPYSATDFAQLFQPA